MLGAPGPGYTPESREAPGATHQRHGKNLFVIRSIKDRDNPERMILVQHWATVLDDKP
jgi:hypothetical protein